MEGQKGRNSHGVRTSWTKEDFPEMLQICLLFPWTFPSHCIKTFSLSLSHGCVCSGWGCEQCQEGWPALPALPSVSCFSCCSSLSFSWIINSWGPGLCSTCWCCYLYNSWISCWDKANTTLFFFFFFCCCSEAKAAPETFPHRFSGENSSVHTVAVLCCALSRQLWKSSLGSAGLLMQGSFLPPAGRCCSLVWNDPRSTWDVSCWSTWKDDIWSRLCWWESYWTTCSFNHGPWCNFWSLCEIYPHHDEPCRRKMLFKAPTCFTQVQALKPRNNHRVYLLASQDGWPGPLRVSLLPYWTAASCLFFILWNIANALKSWMILAVRYEPAEDRHGCGLTRRLRFSGR